MLLSKFVHGVSLLVVAVAFQCATIDAQTSPSAEPGASIASPESSPAPPTAAEARSQKKQHEVGEKFAEGWGAKIQHGGTTALVQFLVSIFGAGFALERFFNLRRSKIAPKGLVLRANQMWEAGKMEELEQLENTEPSSLSRAISFIVRHREAPMLEVSTMVGELVSREMSVAHRLAYPLGVVATLEPLLGLLGMILGMIKTFEIVALAGALGDPSQLATGISEALVTTGLGLALAIPALTLYHYFKSKTNMFSDLLGEQVTDLLTAWLLTKEKRP